MRGMLGAKQDHQFVAGAADASGSYGQNGVARPGVFEQENDAVLHRADVVDVFVAGFANGACQRLAGHAGNRCFAGGVDVGDYEQVGLIKGAREFLPEMLRAAKTVRLKQHQQAVELAAAGGFERGLDLRGMMAVVIDDGDVVDRTFDVETAADSGKVLQTPANQCGGNVEIEGDGGCGGGVAHVVNARRMRQTEQAEVVAFVGQAELAGQTLQLNIADKQVGLARGAIGKNWPLDARNDGLNVGLIQAEDGRAIEGNAVHELGEGVLDVGERRVLVEVFPIDGGDDGHHRRKEKKAAVAFVRLHDKVFAFPEPGRGAGLIHLAANHKGRIEMSCGEDGSDERRSRGLAVRSADGDAVFQPHQFGQHLRARDDRDLALVRFRYFGVVGSDRRRRDHDVRALDVCRFVAFVNRGAQVLETLGERGKLGVRAGDGVAESKQNFGDAAHTDAANAHQVYALKIPERNHHENFPLPL